MSKHLHRDLQHLHREILALSALVEEMIDRANRALRDRDVQEARTIVETDKEVDRREVAIEEDCLKMLALHQPVAVDLRRIATVLKVNSDLERIADLAVNIAQRGRSLADFPTFPIPDRLQWMVDISTEMVHGALDAFVNLDPRAALRICARDDEVDRLNAEVISELQTLMSSNPQTVAPAMHCFSASRHIERIADHATNIAEDVIYLVEGEIIRHQFDESEEISRVL